MKQFLSICSVLLMTGCSTMEMGDGSAMQSSGSSINSASSASGAPSPLFDPFLYSGGE